MSSSSQPFQTVHAALWKKPLDSILDDAPPDDGGQVLKYVPAAALQKLQLGRMKFNEEVLLFRKEYAPAFDTLESWWKCSQRGGGIVVTGQPGIGKTVFLFYVLFRRLSAGLPTALQVFDYMFFLFTETGASEHGLLAKNALQLPNGTWALADSSELIEQPCSAFLAAPLEDIWVIQATSPKRSRWREWSKQRDAKIYVMDWFSSNELRTLGQLLDLDIDKLLSHYRTWGPSARTCITLVRGRQTVAQLEQDASDAAAKFVSNPEQFFRLISGFNSDDVSHVLFAVRPEKLLPESREVIRARIPTNHLNGILALAVARFAAFQQSLCFGQISPHPWTKGSAGRIFKKFVYIRLTSVSAPPLTCISANNATTLTIPVCRAVRPPDGKTALREANKHKLPFYWRLTPSSFTSIDGIVCTDSDIFLVQVTVASKRDVKVSGLDTIYDGLPVKFRQQRNWRLVFITPTEECARDLRNQSTSLQVPSHWKNTLAFHSCTFMVGQGKLSDAEMNVLARYTGEDDADAEADDDERERDEGQGSETKENDMTIFKPRPAIPGPEEQPDDSEGKVVGESDLRGGSHMTMQAQSDALSGPTYVGPQAILDKGKGKAVEKSVPKKRSRNPDQGSSSSQTRRTRRNPRDSE